MQVVGVVECKPPSRNPHEYWLPCEGRPAHKQRKKTGEGQDRCKNHPKWPPSEFAPR